MSTENLKVRNLQNESGFRGVSIIVPRHYVVGGKIEISFYDIVRITNRDAGQHTASIRTEMRQKCVPIQTSLAKAGEGIFVYPGRFPRN